MNAPSKELAGLVETLESLRGEIGRLSERVAALEAAAATPGRAAVPAGKERSEAVPKAPAPAPAPAAAGLSEELVLVIGAAIAAYLGKRAHIRQIRLIGTGAWAQQGRVMIQASHALSVHSVRSQP
ncbi:MAG: hypothetical protein U0790_15890 [Isosphaeraceae bacterium]